MTTNEKRQKLSRKKQQEYRRIRIATFLALILLIAIVVLIVVSCNNKKTKQPLETTAPETTTAADDIPVEYVEPTYFRDNIEITDEWPTVGTSTDYSLYVNTALNATTLYKVEGDVYTPLRVMACSTGRRDGHETPEGTFYLGEWIIGPDCEWCYMADGTEGLYAYRIIDGINNDIMFHSVPFLETDHGTIEYEEYNKLGNYASMGCIRMAIADVRYLGQLCAGGTEVYIYYDENEILPMEKPAPLFIPPTVEQVRGWDPTDPVSDNPWHSYTFTLEVPNSIEVGKDTEYSDALLLSEAKATDCYGNDVSEYIKCSGTVNTSEKGKYTVTITLDLGQYHATKDVIVVVK